jgi:uncharacterized YigZ family protein
MEKISDTYKTIVKPYKSEIYKVKGSKFIGYAFPVKTQDQIKEFIKQVKDEHYKARHWCYAWQFGYNKNKQYRVNDDGEPSNSAGQPILGQIHSFELTDILVVVVRYFGGIKLGVGGLVSAYKIAAKMVLEKSDIVVKTINFVFGIQFEYKEMDKILQILKKNEAKILDRKMEFNCKFLLEVRMNNKDKLIADLKNTRCVELFEV